MEMINSFYLKRMPARRKKLNVIIPRVESRETQIDSAINSRERSRTAYFSYNFYL